MSRPVSSLCLLVLAGCSHFTTDFDSRAASPKAADSSRDECLVDDGDDGDDQIANVSGRRGHLYTFADDKGTTVWPGESAFALAEGGAGGSPFSIRLRGDLADAEGAYAGLGLDFTNPRGPYDASRYAGLEFVARRAPGSLTTLRVKAPDVNTDPAGKICKECFNDFGAEVALSEQWTRYVIKFVDLEQQQDWGEPRPEHLTQQHLYGLQWQVADRGSHFDIWIDDIRFLGCE